jgi:hypothetical protein
VVTGWNDGRARGKGDECAWQLCTKVRQDGGSRLGVPCGIEREAGRRGGRAGDQEPTAMGVGSALATHSWPLRLSSAVTSAAFQVKSLLRGPPTVRGPHLQAPAWEVKLQLRIRPQDIGTHVFCPLLFFTTIAPHRCSIETSVHFLF